MSDTHMSKSFDELLRALNSISSWYTPLSVFVGVYCFHIHSSVCPSVRSCCCKGIITKTCLHNVDPLKPHFYIVKLGFTGVYIIFLISAQNIDCGYSLEPPRT